MNVCQPTCSSLGARRLWFVACVVSLLALLPTSVVRAQGVIAWGSNQENQCSVPSPNSGFVAVSAGLRHSLGLKSDGTIFAWGDNHERQCNVPSPNSGFVAVSAGSWHSLGLKSDGTVAAWGWNNSGQCDVPSPNSDFIAVSAGYGFSLGLKSDSTVVAWGINDSGQCNVPSPNSGFVAVSAGYDYCLGLKFDGMVVAWGLNDFGRCDVPSPNSGFMAVAAGGYHSLGLKFDGTVIAWGCSYDGRTDVPTPNSDFVAVSAGTYHSLGVKSDGTVVAWGLNTSGQCDVPSPNAGFVGVAAGQAHSLGLQGEALGIYANDTGTNRRLCAGLNVPASFYLLGRVPISTPPGLTGAEFRIEIANPTGYLFSYTPPSGASAYGSPFDLTPTNPNDPTGTTVLFVSCQLPSPQLNNFVDFGRVNVVNLAGGTTTIRVRAKQPPGSPSMPCPRFFLCDSPLFTPICMAPVVRDDIVYEATLNGPGCLFSIENLLLDTHEPSNDGAAGPVGTSQVLAGGKWYVVDVQGTSSLTGSTAWASPPNVVCGIPEPSPQTASPGVTNHWVGADAEINFAAALVPGSDCNSMEAQGYPRHHLRFQVDLGNGFMHMEPLGGAPSDPAPSHRYRFLVEGQNTPASFRWEDAQTSDNYGVLSIRVEEVTPTEVNPTAESMPRPNKVLMLASVPNPFNPTTVIRYVLPQDTEVTVEVYDIRGRAIRHLFGGPQSGGNQSVTWDGRLDSGIRAPSGTYFAHVTTPVGSGAQRMTLVK